MCSIAGGENCSDPSAGGDGQGEGQEARQVGKRQGRWQLVAGSGVVVQGRQGEGGCLRQPTAER
eukprot:14886775-Alexandrium_andersonii.AAC.1